MGLIDIVIVPHESIVYHASGRYEPLGIDHKWRTPCGMFWYTNEVNAEMVGEDEAWEVFGRRPCMKCYAYRYTSNDRRHMIKKNAEILRVDRQWI